MAAALPKIPDASHPSLQTQNSHPNKAPTVFLPSTTSMSVVLPAPEPPISAVSDPGCAKKERPLSSSSFPETSRSPESWTPCVQKKEEREDLEQLQLPNNLSVLRVLDHL